MEKTFTLASFNICSAHFAAGHYTEENLVALAGKIRESGAQVVALQEVDQGAARSERVDMPTRLSAMSGLPYQYFIKIRDFQGGAYGTAILSGYPILAAKTIPYPVTVATQGTSCGYVTLDLGGLSVTVFNTHLSVESEEANTDTLRCLSGVLRDWRATHTDGFVCCGDFNTTAEKILRYIPDVRTAHTGLLTYAHINSIDHMIYTDPLVLSHVRLLDTCTDRTTDHSMLLADVTVTDRMEK